jgi:hypothetical protein
MKNLKLSKLGELVDAYGSLKEQITALSEKAEKVGNVLKESLEMNETVKGKKFQVTLSERLITELDPKKVKEILTEPQFLDSIKILQKKASLYLSKEQLDKCVASRNTTTILRLKSK